MRNYVDYRMIFIFCAHKGKHMSFRADEAAIEGRERAITKLISKLPPDNRNKSLDQLDEYIEQYGPVVDGYPTWHPFVWSDASMSTHPDRREHGYEGLDHVVYLKNAFISCPYAGQEKLVETAERREQGPFATIEAEILELQLYHPRAKPVLVKCVWDQSLRQQRMTIARWLENEIRFCHKAEVAETWDNMRSYFLGSPHGSRSSLFVSEETGSAMKRIWNSIIESGAYGPIMTIK